MKGICSPLCTHKDIQIIPSLLSSGRNLTVTIVTFIISHIERLDPYRVVIPVIWTKRCTGDKASGNEGKWDVTVLSIVLVVCIGGPELFVMTLGGDEFLLQRDSVGRIRENIESHKAASQCFIAIERSVMDGTQGAVTAIYLCNDKELMGFTHFEGSVWKYSLSKVER